ncbi:MAG: hypothetical protein F4213_13105 [Boseongicola sp. SB0677_bin_26]|nr:hypothetical protein [Boseongicola sp. SB0665_bin_10]MYG26938.1 hypothetical protein [Boseongicola sp. SB0677_bin_26]
MTHDKLTKALDALRPLRDHSSSQHGRDHLGGGEAIMQAATADILDVTGINAEVFLRDTEAESPALLECQERPGRDPAYIPRRERQQDHRYPFPAECKAMSIANAFAKEGSGTYPPDPCETTETAKGEIDDASGRHRDNVEALHAEAYVLSAKRQVSEVETELLGLKSAVVLRDHDVLSAKSGGSALKVLYTKGGHVVVRKLLAEARAHVDETNAPIAEARTRIAGAEASLVAFNLLVEIHEPLQDAKGWLREAQAKLDEANALIATNRDQRDEGPPADEIDVLLQAADEGKEAASVASVPQHGNLIEIPTTPGDLESDAVQTVFGLDSFSVVKDGVDEGESPVFLAGDEGVVAIDLVEIGSTERGVLAVRVRFADDAIRIFPMQSVWALGRPIRRERLAAKGWTRAGK